MKKLILLIFFIKLSNALYAQIELNAGINNFTIKDIVQVESGFGYQLGMDYITPIVDNLRFQTGIILEKNNASITEEFWGKSILNGNDFKSFDFSINYLKIPAYFNVNMKSFNDLSLFGGLKFGFMISDKQTVSDDIDYGLNFEKTNICLGAGATYIPSDFGAKIEFQYGITPVVESESGSFLNWINKIESSPHISFLFSFVLKLNNKK